MTEQLSLFDPSELECFVADNEAINAELRFYDKDHCWQYDIRLTNLQDDLRAAQLTPEEAARLTVHDFRFKVLTSEWDKAAAAQFIRRHEWLGNLSQYTTHWFGAYHGNVLAGVLLFNLPNAFSKLLGEDTPNIERLISRGACISWSPKNLASSFIMWSINWMVQNTQYRLFTAYSDPMAKELGTVYQACNFYYLGQTAGANVRYINPYSGKIVSDRFFRQRSAYRRFCKELNIEWQSNWCDSTRMLWENVPHDVEQRLRQRSREVQEKAEPVCVPSKHKYAMVLGVNKTETKALRKVFESMNRTFPYPKVR